MRKPTKEASKLLWRNKALFYCSNINSNLIVDLNTGNDYVNSPVLRQSLSKEMFPYTFYIGSTFIEDGQHYYNYVEFITKPRLVYYEEMREFMKSFHKQIAQPVIDKLVNQFYFIIPYDAILSEDFIGSMLNKYHVWTNKGDMLNEHPELPERFINSIQRTTINNV